MQQILDLPRDNFRLVRIGTLDARLRTDEFFSLRELVLRSDTAYPRIGRWFDSKVTSGLRSGERSRSLGDLFFTLMSVEVRQRAQRVRFTLPESVWEDRKAFFHSFNFRSAEKSHRQYRLFDTELYSEAAFPELFAAAKEKLPQIFGQLAIGNHSLLTGAVLALHPTPLEKLFSGTKTVEIRTRFSERWEGKQVSLYATHPISAIAGEATVSRVIPGSPERIWEHFGQFVGCTRSEYDEYVGARDKVNALVLSGVRAFSDPVPLAQLSYMLGIKLPAPQSYLSLENNDGWLAAVALAAALQSSIGVAHLSIHEEARSVPPPVRKLAR